MRLTALGTLTRNPWGAVLYEKGDGEGAFRSAPDSSVQYALIFLCWSSLALPLTELRQRRRENGQETASTGAARVAKVRSKCRRHLASETQLGLERPAGTSRWL